MNYLRFHDKDQFIANVGEYFNNARPDLVNVSCAFVDRSGSTVIDITAEFVIKHVCAGGSANTSYHRCIREVADPMLDVVMYELVGSWLFADAREIKQRIEDVIRGHVRTILLGLHKEPEYEIEDGLEKAMSRIVMVPPTATGFDSVVGIGGISSDIQIGVTGTDDKVRCLRCDAVHRNRSFTMRHVNDSAGVPSVVISNNKNINLIRDR